LRISKTLSKSWLFIYKRAVKKFEMGLGSMATVSLAEAREKARDYQKLLAASINPLAEKRAIRSGRNYLLTLHL
jgi:hypothetical protein